MHPSLVLCTRNYSLKQRLLVIFIKRSLDLSQMTRSLIRLRNVRKGENHYNSHNEKY